MRVLLLEDNLLWSSRLVTSLRALGHEPLLVSRPDQPWPEAPVAIVNLSSFGFPPIEVVPKLRSLGVRTIAHAGHKEQALRTLATELDVEILTTHSELTHRLEGVLQRLVQDHGTTTGTHSSEEL